MPVDPSDRALITIDEAAELIVDADPDDETTADTLQTLINEASDYIHLRTSREFVWVHDQYTDTETRLIPIERWGGYINVGDIQEIDVVTLNGSELTTDDWMLANAPGYSIYPPKVLSLSPTLSPAAVAWPQAHYPAHLLEIEGVWGFAEIPPIIKRACKRTVETWYQKDVQVTSDSYDDTAGGIGFAPVTVADRTFVVPLDVEQILAKFERIGII
jgi:hypothetical protein